MLYVGHLRNSSLISQRLAPNERFSVRRLTIWLAQELPTGPRILLTQCIALRENDEDVTMWRFHPAQRGKPVRIRIEPTLSSNDGESDSRLGARGSWSDYAIEWDVAEDLRAGRLVACFTTGDCLQRTSSRCSVRDTPLGTYGAIFGTCTRHADSASLARNSDNGE